MCFREYVLFFFAIPDPPYWKPTAPGNPLIYVNKDLPRYPLLMLCYRYKISAHPGQAEGALLPETWPELCRPQWRQWFSVAITKRVHEKYSQWCHKLWLGMWLAPLYLSLLFSWWMPNETGPNGPCLFYRYQIVVLLGIIRSIKSVNTALSNGYQNMNSVSGLIVN
jgi:hypothetical protein